MTKEEIYEHLAKVYLGKKKKKKKQKNLRFYTLLFINVVTLPLIISLVVGAVNSRSVKPKVKTKNSLFLSLNAYPLRISYDFRDDRPQVQDFVVNLPEIDISKYAELEFSLKGARRGYPRLIKLSLQNRRREIAYYYLSDISGNWRHISIPLSEFKGLNDFSSLTRISFSFESWNQINKKGSVLIEDLGFSGDNRPVNRL